MFGKLLRIASLGFVLLAASAAAAAPSYTAQVRLSQFDNFTTESSLGSVSVTLDGGILGSATSNASGHSMDVEAIAITGGATTRTSDSDIDDIGVTFSSSINALAAGGIITVLIPYELTYNVDVPEPPDTFNQGTASLDVLFNARLQPADSLIVQESGLLTLLNSAFSHVFVNQTGPFLLATAQEDTLVTINGTFSVDLPEDPGNPIKINLDTQLSADAGATTGGSSAAEALLTFEWDLGPNAITDGGGTPLSASDVGYSLTGVPSAGPVGLGVMLAALAAIGAYSLRRR